MKIVKKLLGGFIILVCALFFVPNNVYAVDISSASKLQEAFAGKSAIISETTITLTGDVEFKNSDFIPDTGDFEYDVMELSGADYVLNLNNFSLKVHDLNINDGSLKIIGSKFQGTVFAYGCIIVFSGAKLEIENGIYNANFLNYGTLNIKNGTFYKSINNSYEYDWQKEQTLGYGVMTIENGTFSGVNQEGKATINGGTFRNSDFESALNIGIFEDNSEATTTITGGKFISSDPEIHSAIAILKSSGDLVETEINKHIKEGYKVVYDDATIYTEYACPMVSYTETVIVYSNVVDETFNKLAPNGVMTLNSSKPKNELDADFLLTAVVSDMGIPEGYNVQVGCYGSEFNPENGVIAIYKGSEYITEKKVQIVYNEPTTTVKSSISPILSEIAKKTGEEADVENGFRLEDLYLINYLNATKNGVDYSLALNFAKDLIKLTNGGNISYKFDFRKGDDGTDLWSSKGGQAIVYYDGVAIDTTEIGLTINHVLYVPSTTKDTDEARIAAALKRIKDYLSSTDGITIEVGGALSSTGNQDYAWNKYGFVDEATSGSNYYNVTINGKTYKFAICKKDTSELENPEYLASDLLSSISIKSNSTELPLDTAITVKAVTSDNIEKVLGTNVYAAYDISLYSNAKKVDITKLENGKFIVSIPVPEILKDKQITVYYINSNGEKEEHLATLKDGIASFETNHFSTYVLAEKTLEEDDENLEDKEEILEDEKEENPKTFDNINTTILIGAISFLIIVAGVIYLKKEME